MKEFSIETLAKIIKAEPIVNAGVFTGVSIDSRTTKAGDCFFAINGDNFDGTDFLADAFAKGAVCAVVGRKVTDGKKLNVKRSTLNANKILKVDDTIKALGDFAREYRRQGNFKVVAITGSVGKTMTRQIAYHILSQYFRVFQAPKNFNNNIGLPLTLLAADPEDEIIIAELGSNCPGEITYLTRIAQPDIAVVTNVYLAHLAGFGDLQTIIQEKLSISEGLKAGGALIINGDFDQLVSACRARGIGFVTFGSSDGCNIRARNIIHTGFASRFSMDGPMPCGNRTQVVLPLAGTGNVENALAAWSICGRFGINIDDFAKAIKTLPPVPMRAELLQIGTLTVLSDCYNANPASMKNALNILTGLPFCNKSQNGAQGDIGSAKKRRLTFICGDMAELGQQAQALHTELGVFIAKAKVQLLLTVGKFARVAAEAAKRTAKYDLQTKSFEDTISACNNLAEFIKDYDIILVKGSRVAKLEMAVQKLKELFS